MSHPVPEYDPDRDRVSRESVSSRGRVSIAIWVTCKVTSQSVKALARPGIDKPLKGIPLLAAGFLSTATHYNSFKTSGSDLGQFSPQYVDSTLQDRMSRSCRFLLFLPHKYHVSLMAAEKRHESHVRSRFLTKISCITEKKSGAKTAPPWSRFGKRCHLGGWSCFFP